jgi:Tol biopolymer transport system component
MTSNARLLTRTAITACCAAALGAAGAATSPGQAADGPGTTTRVSVSGSEAQADGATYGSSALSANGRFVVFSSEASNLVAGDTNGVSDVFVRELSSGTTRRISVSSAERQADGESLGGVAITPTGRFVAFTSNASNLVGHDTNGNADVFVRDLVHGTTRRVSLTDTDRQGGLGGGTPAISADGRYVAFLSYSGNLVRRDTNGHPDVFVRDRSRGTTRRVSVTSAEKQVYLGGTAPAISAGGRYVAFVSDSRSLVTGDTNKVRDVFLRDRSRGTTRRVSLTSAESQLSAYSYGPPSLSAGGRYVAFLNGGSVLVRDRTAGTTEEVSVGNGTSAGGRDSDAAPVRISGDGRYVVFTSFSALVAGDGNLRDDVFVRDRAARTLERVSVSSAGTEGHGHSRTGSVSDDGRLVTFSSGAPDLVLGDTNGADDQFTRTR